jgi:hypothetical protein
MLWGMVWQGWDWRGSGYIRYMVPVYVIRKPAVPNGTATYLYT